MVVSYTMLGSSRSFGLSKLTDVSITSDFVNISTSSTLSVLATATPVFAGNAGSSSCEGLEVGFSRSPFNEEGIAEVDG
jgi:hypothetical protein